MALAFDAASGWSYNGGGSTCTVSHTVGAGSNRILVAYVATLNTGATMSATYNGVAMTAVGSVVGSSKIWSFYLLNPDSGTHDIVFTSNASADMAGGGLSYTGAKQSAQPDASGSNNDTSSPLTISVTTVDDNSWVTACFMAGFGGTVNSASVGTLRGTQAFGGTLADNGPITPAGTGTITIDKTGADAGDRQLMVAISPAIADPAVDLNDAVTVAETIAMMVDDDPNVNDAVAVAEDVAMMVDDDPNVFDGVTVAEDVTIEILSGPSGTEDVTITEVVSLIIDPIVPSVSDDVTLTEVVAVEWQLEISVSDAVAVAESVSAQVPFEPPTIADDVAVTEDVTVMVSLDPSVNDAVTITEAGGASGPIVIAAPRSDLIHMRSTEQDYPLMMDEDEVR
jgi:hypothetical protein